MSAKLIATRTVAILNVDAVEDLAADLIVPCDRSEGE